MPRAHPSRTATPRLLAGAAVAALLLTACHGKTETKPVAELTDAPAATPADAPIATPVAQPADQATAAGEVTSQQLAEKLAGEAVFTYAALPEGFTAQQDKMSCTSPGGGIAYICQLQYSDDQHHNREADLKFLIFDKPVDFAAFDSKLKEQVAGEPGFIKGSAPAVFEATLKDGSKLSRPGECRQSLGAPNGMARCAFLADPRVVMLTIVKPANAVRSDGDVDSADIDRAKSLGLAGYSVLVLTKFSSVQASEAQTTASGAMPSSLVDNPIGEKGTPAYRELMRRVAEITGSNAAKDDR